MSANKQVFQLLFMVLGRTVWLGGCSVPRLGWPVLEGVSEEPARVLLLRLVGWGCPFGTAGSLARVQPSALGRVGKFSKQHKLECELA